MLIAATPPPPAIVRIKDIDFHPHRLAVKRGTRVKWRFLDGVTQHNVTSTGKRRFKSSPDLQKGTYAVTFKKTGTYRYVCTIHLNMKARVVVG